MRSDSGTGSGRSNTLWTTENSAVLAPMHSARVSAAVRVNALSRHSSRRPTRRSDSIVWVDVPGRPEVSRSCAGPGHGGDGDNGINTEQLNNGVKNGKEKYFFSVSFSVPRFLRVEPLSPCPPFSRRVLFRPQRLGRIDARGPPGGDEVGQRRDGEQQRRRAEPGERVADADAVQHARDHA